jgi:predicted nuclease of predicted toxin-antitoxin system
VKLLFDQNISFRLLKTIADIFPQSYAVKDLNLTNSSDLEIWRYAKDNNFTIVTFDADFFDLNTLYGGPPKIIWLKTGNMTTALLARLFKEQESIIKDFIKDKESDFLLLSNKNQE